MARARVSISSTTGASKQTATASGTSMTHTARDGLRRHRSPGRYRCHEPFMRRCVWSVRPTSKPTSRCLPWASTRSIRAPTTRSMCAPPGRARAAVTVRPEQHVPQDGGGPEEGVALRHPATRRRPGRDSRPRSRPAPDLAMRATSAMGSAVDALDLEGPQPAVGDQSRQGAAAPALRSRASRERGQGLDRLAARSR